MYTDTHAHTHTTATFPTSRQYNGISATYILLLAPSNLATLLKIASFCKKISLYRVHLPGRLKSKIKIVVQLLIARSLRLKGSPKGYTGDQKPIATSAETAAHMLFLSKPRTKPVY